MSKLERAKEIVKTNIVIICVIASIFIVKMIIEADIPLWLKVWLLS